MSISVQASCRRVRPPAGFRFAWTLAILWGASAIGWAQDAPRPDRSRRDFTSGASCSDAGCHAGLVKTRWVHGPVAARACQVCHRAEGPATEHRFAATREAPALCGFCHEAREALPSSHEPYAKGECVRCHDPHGGADRRFLKTSAVSLCHECHERKPYEHEHFPEGRGDCLSCHAGHQSRHAGLLVLPAGQLCITCHDEHREPAPGAKPAFVHAALTDPKGQGCLSCHDPHGGRFDGLLAVAPDELCSSCHESVLAPEGGAVSAHGAFGGEKTCSGCHEPHRSPLEHLLRERPDALCLSCHDRAIRVARETDDGRSVRRTIASVSAQIDGATSIHAPVADGSCTACHVAHASINHALLRHGYTESIYSTFSRDAYALCFVCHDERLASLEKTTVTNFRDGDRNLHHLHVNRDKGRSCAICHTAHGSAHGALLRESIAFGPGGWKLPIGHSKTATGGTCASGCHRELGYDKTTVPRRPGDEPRRPAPSEGEPGK